MPYTPPAGAIFLDLSRPAPASLPLVLEFDPDIPASASIVEESDSAAFQAEARPPDALASLAATEGDDTAAFALAASAQASLAIVAATEGDDELSAAVVLDSNVSRGVFAGELAGWNQAAPANAQASARWRTTPTVPAAIQGRWQAGRPVGAKVSGRWRNSPGLAPRVSAGWRDAQAQAALTRAGWRHPPGVAPRISAGWRDAQALAALTRAGWRYPPTVPRRIDAHWQDAAQVRVRVMGRVREGGAVRRGARAAWREAPRPDWRPLWASGPVVPPNPPPVPGRLIRLDFSGPLPGGGLIRLNFGPLVNVPHVVYIGESIIVDNSISVIRVSDEAEIEAVSTRLSRDITQSDWELQLDVADLDAIEMLRPANAEPIELLVTINGYAWRIAALSATGPRKFAAHRAQITGRSLSALLGNPYFRGRNYSNLTDQLAAQLCDAELQYTGWEMAYHPDILTLMTQDWLVETGGFSYQNKSPMEAIGMIAVALGAQLYCDRTDAKLHMAPRYVLPPWQWATATPDVVIPSDFVSVAGERISTQPAWNQAIVSGQSRGVRVTARRTGTAGNIPAPDAVDALITHPQVGRLRGISILAGAGRQAVVSLEDVPITTGMGLVEPGMLVEVQETSGAWIGLCTANTIGAQLGRVTQAPEIERHYL